MGVDYYNCSICGVIFNDCGNFGWCDNCGARLCEECHEAQVEKNGEVGEDGETDYGEDAAVRCDLCSGEIITDSDIIDYFLTKTGQDKDEVVAIIKNVRKMKDAS